MHALLSVFSGEKHFCSRISIRVLILFLMCSVVASSSEKSLYFLIEIAGKRPRQYICFFFCSPGWWLWIRGCFLSRAVNHMVVDVDELLWAVLLRSTEMQKITGKAVCRLFFFFVHRAHLWMKTCVLQKEVFICFCSGVWMYMKARQQLRVLFTPAVWLLIKSSRTCITSLSAAGPAWDGLWSGVDALDPPPSSRVDMSLTVGTCDRRPIVSGREDF